MKFEKGVLVRVLVDYDAYGKNAKGLKGVILRPKSVDRTETVRYNTKRIVKHLIYIEEIDEYCEPLEEWLEIVKDE